MIHFILALIFLSKLFTSSRYSAPKYFLCLSVQLRKILFVVMLLLNNSNICLGYCHGSECNSLGFSCNCRSRIMGNLANPTNESYCIEYSWICNGLADCEDGSDEIDCICEEDQFQCNTCKRSVASCNEPFYCIPAAKVGDGEIDCMLETDEIG